MPTSNTAATAATAIASVPLKLPPAEVLVVVSSTVVGVVDSDCAAAEPSPNVGAETEEGSDERDDFEFEPARATPGAAIAGAIASAVKPSAASR